MKIYLAADHAGFELKEKVKAHLEKNDFEVVDCGAYSLEPGDDYPLYMHEAALRVSKEAGTRALLFGGSGQGEAIEANKHKRVRAAVYYGGDARIITLSREHNDANVLSIGARFVSDKEALDAIDIWLKTPFSKEERHVRRIKEIDELDL